jgi:hypothetical protein
MTLRMRSSLWRCSSRSPSSCWRSSLTASDARGGSRIQREKRGGGAAEAPQPCLALNCSAAHKLSWVDAVGT